MKAFLVNYNFIPTWLLESGLDYHIMDRSDSKEYLKDFPPERVSYDENMGQVDYPKLRYLVDNYDNLPEVFLWGKTNLWKYVTEEEYNLVKDNQTFTPLLTQNHKIYRDNNGWVNYYSAGMYYERNDIAQAAMNQFSSKYFHTYSQFAHAFQLPNPSYIPFAPGGNYILTRERVHRYSVDYYKRMAQILPYARENGEAQMVERSYYQMWK